jgi:hypothetical protein
MFASVFLGFFSYFKVSLFSAINRFSVINKKYYDFQTSVLYPYTCLFIPAVLLTKRKPFEIAFDSQYKDVSGYVVSCMFVCYCGLKMA